VLAVVRASWNSDAIDSLINTLSGYWTLAGLTGHWRLSVLVSSFIYTVGLFVFWSRVSD